MSGSETNKEFFGSYWNDNMITYLSQSAGGRWGEYLLGQILEEIPSDSVTSVADVGCGVGKKTAKSLRTFRTPPLPATTSPTGPSLLRRPIIEVSKTFGSWLKTSRGPITARILIW